MRLKVTNVRAKRKHALSPPKDNINKLCFKIGDVTKPTCAQNFVNII